MKGGRMETMLSALVLMMALSVGEPSAVVAEGHSCDPGATGFLAPRPRGGWWGLEKAARAGGSQWSGPRDVWDTDDADDDDDLRSRYHVRGRLIAEWALPLEVVNLDVTLPRPVRRPDHPVHSLLPPLLSLFCVLLL